MNNQEKRCGNCKYFAWHYIKFKSRLLKTDCGHCANSAYVVTKCEKRRDSGYYCELWEPCEIAVAERKELIEEKLLQITAQLGDIALILKDEKGEGKN
ncbi:MAG: hypothetical protein K2I20_05050 [Clostridia bacterium]|nr:hypothetical protein [Clostridia bacterium]MDE7214354.1 hypothetical protein [Clostridia bacterium]